MTTNVDTITARILIGCRPTSKLATNRRLSTRDYCIYLDLDESVVTKERVPVAIFAHIKSRVGRMWKARRLDGTWKHFNECKN